MNNLLKIVGNSCQLLESSLFKLSAGSPCYYYIINRGIKKHWKPEFKKLRGQKVIKVDLPDYEKYKKPVDEMSKEEIKSRMKEMGVLPARNWIEKPIYIACTGGIFEPYIPPEGDGKVSVITTQGAKQKLEFIEKKSKSLMALRKIRTFEEEFETYEFGKLAQDIYINSYLAMISKDKDKIIQYITERAYPEVVHNIGDKTMHWEFIESIDPPKIAHIRCTNVVTQDNIFSQITVRFHTKQKLAIYDRFGRLMYGNETLPKDVLEYVVFEKHLSNKYGRWRVHDKIIPDWMPPKEPIKRTFPLKPEIQDNTIQEDEVQTDTVKTSVVQTA